MENNRATRNFRRMAVITLLAVLFLIWVGAMVRATDSGMGCPDWPTCFGRWVPPTDVSQLPLNYKEIYASHGYAQNDFDPRKTWIEYTNRLTGTSIGLLVLITLILAWRQRRQSSLTFRMSLGAFLAVGLNGWLGAVVVKTNLHPAVLTTHMLLSFAVIGCLIIALVASLGRDTRLQAPQGSGLRGLLMVAILATIIQVTLGAQVREQVDQIAALAADFYARDGWIAQLGNVFLWHRLFALVVVLLNCVWVWRILRDHGAPILLRRAAWLVVALLLAIILLGSIMLLFSIPPMAQPLHLFLVVCLFSVQSFTLCTQLLTDKWSSYTD